MSRVASARWAAKDLILSILSRLGASGAVGHAIEFTQMLDRMATLVQTGNSAVIADAYTGCGGLLNVARTVKGCERAGVTVIRIEDPEFPNKCGHKRSSVACRWRRWSRRSASRAKRAQTKKTS